MGARTSLSYSWPVLGSLLSLDEAEARGYSHIKFYVTHCECMLCLETGFHCVDQASLPLPPVLRLKGCTTKEATLKCPATTLSVPGQ